MERILSFFRAHPVFIGIAAFTAFLIVLFAFFAYLFVRSGLSLRPLVFLGVYFLIIGVPQVVGHFLEAFGIMPPLVWTPANTRAPLVEKPEALRHDGGRFAEPERVFGPGFDPQLVMDQRALFAPHRPEVAQLAVFPNGETALVARFATPAEASAAHPDLLQRMGVTLVPTAKKDVFHAARLSDSISTLVAERTVFVWSGADGRALERREDASRAAWGHGTPPPRDPREIRAWKIMGVVLPLLLVVAVLWFFKGSSWAAAIPALPSATRPVPADELRTRLLAAGQTLPHVSVTPGQDDREVVVTWRTDAAWITSAEVAGLRRVHRYVIRLDETDHKARVVESFTSLDAVANANGAAVQWHRTSGIVFFEYRHERIYALHFDPSTGRFQVSPEYKSTYDAQSLKAPFIHAVTASGWDWKPVIWNAPAALRWATE